MGLIPKYKLREIVIDEGFKSDSKEHFLLIRERSLNFSGLKPIWSYTGELYEISKIEPLELKYSTTPSFIQEDNLKSLTSRLRNP